MRYRHRGVIVVLAALQLAACRHWQGQFAGPREVLTGPDISHVRLTHTNRQTVEVRVAEVRGDTVYGTVGSSGPLSCVEAGPLCSFMAPITEIGFVETREFSAIRTVALLAVPVGLFAVTFVVDRCDPITEICD